METVDIFYRYVKSNFSVSDSDAQDLIATLYLKIWNGLDSYKENSNFSSWVWTIFKNLILDHFKLDKYTAFSEFNTIGEEDTYSFEENIESDDNLLEQVDTKYRYEEIMNAMQKLDDIYKEVLHLKFIEDLSYEEIADITNTSNDNVRKRLSRAIKMLKDFLGSSK